MQIQNSTGPSLMDSLLQRSIDDLIKGIRLSPPGTESTFIARSLDEIRREIKSTDPETKSIALHKLTYLHSLHGVDTSWAAFHAVELSSATAHSHKRIAFLYASLSFDPSTTKVILLLTHQLRKDLSSSNAHEVSFALSTLSSICNPDLARDLNHEIFTLLGSSKILVRKKAIASALRVFEHYPDAVRVYFKRVVENLENTDMGVLSAVVGLFCELAENEPRSYLPLAPEFYKILVDCRNNWVLIKVLKIFAKLAPLEPRLGKKVVQPICEHMERTGAKSLVFECVRTILTSLSEYDSAVKLAVGKVHEFLLEDDPNLRYLGLQALAIVARTNMWAVLENKELVVKALSDADDNIKLEALRLVMCMVSEDNVIEICRVLISQALKSDPKFCNEILDFILSTCSRNIYEVVYDFDWYVSFLGEMARVPYCQKGSEIETQLVDIGMRVKDARFQLVHVSRDLVIDPALLGNPSIHVVLAAAAWASGEYIELSRNPFEIMDALLQPRTSLLTTSVRAVYIQSVFKVFVFCLNSYLELNIDDSSYPSVSTTHSDYKSDIDASHPLPDTELDNADMVVTSSSSRTHHFTLESILALVNLVETNLGPLAGSNEVEVQERASNVLGLIKLIKPELLGSLDKENEVVKSFDAVKLIFGAFSEDLGPVSYNAQERVPIPDGLVFKENLCDLEEIFGETEFSLSTSFSLVEHQNADVTNILEHPNKEEGPSTESTSLLAEHRKRHGLYYLPSENAGFISNDYPPAHDPKDEIIDEAGGLVKITEESLVIKKKPNQAKPRPLVVKLDDGEGFNASAKTPPEFKADPISGVVQEVLLGNEATMSTSKKHSSKHSSKRREISELNVGVFESKNEIVKAEIDFPVSGRRKHHERKRRSYGKDKEQDQKDKQKSERGHGTRKPRQRSDGAMEAQSPVIPDFLL
ncbi:hypothetical protein CASFOL_008160 [Castilleja foliolosa]|uniref:AP-3 complex subunit delta n=1 Tax=Castilleja foliolosa TaxID=1961234 RepID=A0ABD3DZW4_9LAMI